MIWTYGVINVDVMVHTVDQWPERGIAVFADRIDFKPGGPAINPAIAIAKLGEKPIGIAGYIGTDPSSQLLLETLRTHNIDTSRIVRSDTLSTGTCIVCVHSDAERSFIPALGANAQVGTDLSILDGLGSNSVVLVCATLIKPELCGDSLRRLVRHIKAQQAIVAVDLLWNHKRSAWAELEPAAPHIDILMANEFEFECLAGTKEPSSAARKIASAGVATVALKLGGMGAYILAPDWEGFVEAFPVEPVDTTGAGDAFAAAFVYGLQLGWGSQQAATFANAAGALNTLAEGPSDGVAWLCGYGCLY